MEIRKTFAVRARPQTVWIYFTNPQWIAACLPGAAITGRVDDKTYKGEIAVKVGPVATRYRGHITFKELDAAAWKAEIVASGQDVRGKGGADMRISSRLVERTPGETEVTVVSEVNVTGILAQMGRGMIQEVSDQMFQEFTAAMSASLKLADPTHQASPDAAALRHSKPIQVASFSRVAGHPVTWVVVVAAAALVWWLWLR
jgi:uncharacterized protein